jgi:hypothetical protein
MSFIENDTAPELMKTAMRNQPPETVLQWLKSQPSLEELSAEFPEVREIVRRELAELIATGTAAELPAYLTRLSQAERLFERKFHSSRGDKKIASELVQQSVSTRVAHLSIKQHLIAEATGITKGKVRFNLLNGYLAQKLLFAQGLERKPVSLGWFRFVWPFVWQRRVLMPLVQPEGIYCFYSRQLIAALGALIGTRSTLEIAAGDGTLTRFLAEKGVQITATDDHSWKQEVTYPDSVIRQSAQDALRAYSPAVVLCSWPPAGNSFEQQVFRTKSVQLYIVIGSRHRFAAGNWQAYEAQTTFDYDESEALSRLVLPPELNAAVYIFRRKAAE